MMSCPDCGSVLSSDEDGNMVCIELYCSWHEVDE